MFPTQIHRDTDDQELLDHFENEKIKFNDIFLTAQKRAIQDKLTNYFKTMIDNEHYMKFSCSSESILRRVHILKKECDTIYDVKHGAFQYAFFTINFAPHVKLQDIVSVMHEFTSKQKYVKEHYAYSIEQRSEDPSEVHGLHAHILFHKGNTPPSKLKRCFKNKFFDTYIGNESCLDYRFINDPEKKLKYILGIKEKKKMGKVFCDRIVREKNKVDNIYQCGFQAHIDEIISSDEYINLFSNSNV